ncbi:GerAB/ArcD/ProY family transporter [Sporosarcina jiandibaonis]|uniref:GerAB/ArcD/ProY family transporter n=1 Tax=Sporosarcina jiandibaonis TaxID=2715535 RepID=UPI0015550752|nr:GerAB/ArcD/ProY family transporter [Sporosarcina jiandibaonis]
MIKIIDDKLGTREFTSVVLIAIGMKVTDSTPSLLYEKGANAAWIIPFFYLITIGIPFLVLLSLLKKHEKGLVDLLFHLTGKVGGTLICFILSLLIFFSATTSSRSYIAIANTLFYPKTPVIILTFALLITSFLVAKRGLTAIGSVSWFIIPTLEFLLLILLVSVWKDAHLLSIFPIAGPGLSTLIKESLNHSSIIGEIIILAAFFPFVRSYKNYQVASLLGLGITLFKMSLFLAIYVMVFDYPSTVNMAYPHQELTRIAEFGAGFTHVEGGFFIFWIIASIFRLAIYLYLTAFLLGGALRMDKFEKLLLPLVGLVALSGLLPENEFIMGSYRDLLNKIGSWTFISLPFLLWFLSKLKGGKKNNETDKSAC